MDNSNIEQGQRIGNNTADIKVIYNILKTSSQQIEKLTVNATEEGKKLIKAETKIEGLQKWLAIITTTLASLVTAFMVGVIIVAIKIMSGGN